eukprot:m.715804 g.715804  ORF g.715804 m.715804 type:complete len:58 (+) comp58790_c0_seq20:900-1073(+)
MMMISLLSLSCPGSNNHWRLMKGNGNQKSPLKSKTTDGSLRCHADDPANQKGSAQAR